MKPPEPGLKRWLTQKNLIVFILVVAAILAISWVYNWYYNYTPPMIANPYELCDNDRDGDCDRADYELVKGAIGQCRAGGHYNELADADHDGCVTESDLQQLFPTIPEE